MSKPFSGSPEFQKLLSRSCSTSLARIALEIACDVYPDLDVEHYLNLADGLVRRIKDRVPGNAKPKQVLGQINWVLFVEEGYHGNTEDYYDSRNSYLNDVIDRKTGIPISLSVLYKTLADQLGLKLFGLNLPAHFLLRVEQDGPPLFVDPFHGGALLDRDGCERAIADRLGTPFELTDSHLRPCTQDQVVARILRNLKAIHFRNQDFFSALLVQRRLAALASEDGLEQRDLGMLFLQLDRPADAIVPFQIFLESAPAGEETEVVKALLRAARREVATWN